MKRTEPVHVAVAETSVIVRSGLVAVLKRMPDLTIQPVEITSLEGLQNCMQGHQPDILLRSGICGHNQAIKIIKAECVGAKNNIEPTGRHFITELFINHRIIWIIDTVPDIFTQIQSDVAGTLVQQSGIRNERTPPRPSEKNTFNG